MIRNAGVSGDINVTRWYSDNGGRWPTGLQPATAINPDLVGEVRMILLPRLTPNWDVQRTFQIRPDPNQSIPRWRCLERQNSAFRCPFVVGQSNGRDAAVEKSAENDFEARRPHPEEQNVFLRVI
jgi:hypothetical protein